MTALEPSLFAESLGTATGLWPASTAVVISLLAFDPGMPHRDHREIGGCERPLLSAGANPACAALVRGAGAV